MSIPELALIEAGLTKEQAKIVMPVLEKHCVTHAELRTALAEAHKNANPSKQINFPKIPMWIKVIIVLVFVSKVVLPFLL